MAATPLAVASGSVTPPMIVLLAIVTYAYFKRVHTLKGTRRAVPAWRQWMFGGAIFVLIAEPLSPIGALDNRSFTIHMVEHLVLGDFAPLLMVLGLTGPVIQPLMRNPVIELLRPLALPVQSLVLWTVNMYFWHLPFAMDAALNHDGIHVLQHMLFFSCGFNVWMVLFGPLPQPEWFGNIAKLSYIFVMRLFGVALGNFLIFSGSVFYPYYLHKDNPFGMTPLADQSVAGAVMMSEGLVISFIMLGYLFFKAASEGEESQRLIDLANEHGVELSQSRSDRAAAAGTTDLLRDRIAAGNSAQRVDKT